jgi:Family of unknown function (DUF6488)
MNRHGLSAAMLVLLAATPAVFADEGGKCHFHGNRAANEETVVKCAMQRKDTLVSSGKLDKAWQPVKHERIELVDGKKGKEWKVSFKDPAAKDRGKETLFMFFTPPGNFIAANFTGQ